MTAASRPQIGITIAGQRLKKIMETMILIDLVVIIWSTLRSQENQKAKNWLSPKNFLIREKQKAKI